MEGSSNLLRATELAQQRKEAVGGVQGLHFASEFQDRALFSGFDVDYTELACISTQVAAIFSQAAHGVGLRPLFTAAWCDGLLVGLLLASLPPTTPDAGATDGTGAGGIS